MLNKKILGLEAFLHLDSFDIFGDAKYPFILFFYLFKVVSNWERNNQKFAETRYRLPTNDNPL